MARKFLEQDFANTKPGDPQSKATFGAHQAARTRFGRDRSPHFGLAPLSTNERGVAPVEYALLCALIALAILVSLGRLGGGVGENFNSVDNQMEDAIVFDT